MKNQSNVDWQEIAKFSKQASYWWDTKGPLKTLHAINPTRLEFIKKNCDLKNKRVLDLGCGGGILTEALAREGALVVGLDASFEAIEAAKAHALTNELAINYLCCQVNECELTQFDLITCMEMLEHVPDPQEIVAHCARLLKPDGLLFLSTINRTLKAYATVVVAAEYLLQLLPRQTHDFKKFIKPSELATMVRKAGLKVKTIRGMSYNPWTNEGQLNNSVETNYFMVCSY